MRGFENECIDCDRCVPFCPKKRVERIYCDRCGEESERIYSVGGEELCGRCLLWRYAEDGTGKCEKCSEVGELRDGLCEECFVAQFERV